MGDKAILDTSGQVIPLDSIVMMTVIKADGESHEVRAILNHYDPEGRSIYAVLAVRDSRKAAEAAMNYILHRLSVTVYDAELRDAAK